MSKQLVVAVAVMGILMCGGAFAANITIADEWSSSTGWYGAQEDQEVEPGCVTGQAWDLEGFFLTGSTLTMVGGWDFVAGNNGIMSGDLFIDVTGDAQYGTGAHAGNLYDPSEIVSDTFGYDYVIDLDFSALTYSVVKISGMGAGLQIQTDSEQQNDAANPWKYVSGGAVVAGAGGAIGYQAGLTDAAAQGLGYNVTGGAHNVASVDLAWLLPGLASEFTSHFTQGCGNDNLMGHATMVPEPSTMILLGLGLASIGLRKRVRG